MDTLLNKSDLFYKLIITKNGKKVTKFGDLMEIRMILQFLLDQEVPVALQLFCNNRLVPSKTVQNYIAQLIVEG